jgi:hypothetical protein
VLPKGRQLIFLHFDGEEQGFDARLAAFMAEHGVTPRDNLDVVHVTFTKTSAA